MAQQHRAHPSYVSSQRYILEVYSNMKCGLTQMFKSKTMVT